MQKGRRTKYIENYIIADIIVWYIIFWSRFDK